MDGKYIIQRFEGAKSIRVNSESRWQTLRDYFAPYDQGITSTRSAGDELDFNRIFTSAPLRAVRVMTSGLHSYLTPANSEWVNLRTQVADMMQNKEVKDYLFAVQEELNFTLRNSNFDAAIDEAFNQTGVYGTTSMLIEEDPQDRVRFRTLPIKCVYLMDDYRGKPCEYFITHDMTADQAYEKFGDKLPADLLKNKEDNKNIGNTYPFLYWISKRHDRDPRKKDNKNMPIRAVWVCMSSKEVIDEQGFHEFPLASHRFFKDGLSPYGYSPCDEALFDNRTLQMMEKTNLRAGMKATDPAIALPHRAFLSKINANSGSVNYYQKDAITRDSIFELPAGRGVAFGLEFADRKVQDIRESLFNDVFNMFASLTKQMTVPEVTERIQEKMTLLGPAVGRFQTEFLDTCISRVISILARNGHLPPMPEILMQVGGMYEIEYTAPLAQAQKRAQINRISETFMMATNIAQASPDVLDNIDTDKMIRLAADYNGSPSPIIRGEEDVAMIRQGRAKQQQAIDEAQMMAGSASVAKNVAQASATMAKSGM